MNIKYNGKGRFEKKIYIKGKGKGRFEKRYFKGKG